MSVSVSVSVSVSLSVSSSACALTLVFVSVPVFVSVKSMPVCYPENLALAGQSIVRGVLCGGGHGLTGAFAGEPYGCEVLS